MSLLVFVAYSKTKTYILLKQYVKVFLRLDNVPGLGFKNKNITKKTGHEVKHTDDL